jgi:hypothetical protein
MTSLLDHLADVEKPSRLLALSPRRGKRLKCGRIACTKSSIDRTSYLKVRSLVERRIQPHSKNVCRPCSRRRSFSFNETENDGLTSRPARSFGRIATEMQKHPSPSVRPVTYHGSSGTTTPSVPCLLMRAGVLRAVWISGVTGSRHASPFGSVVRGSRGLPSGSPAALRRRVSPI